MSTNTLNRKPVQSAVPVSSSFEARYLLPVESFAERHFRIGELAKLWGLGRETVRKVVMDEPGVIKIRQGRKKTHTTYSVPESVARRIHNRLSSAA